VRNLTNSWGSEITGNTTTSISVSPSTYNQSRTWNNGDAYEIRRATVCIDQPGRGQSDLLSGSTASPATFPSNAIEPVYLWLNDTSDADLPFGTVGSDSKRVIESRDFYVDAGAKGASCSSPFNGSCGTGAGPRAGIPPSCTAGVAYWATDEGDWSSGASGPDGRLYKCTSPNTWTLSYTPYAYPHPMRGGAQGATSNDTAPPTVVITSP
jgi:hypothetical protein